MQTRILETRGLRKEYPGTVALDDVSVAFEGGRVSALIGRNGAGKSTLVKILAGAVRPSGGSILLDGRTLLFRSPRDALRQGIAAVHQELSLIPELSVGENILLGRWPGRRKPWGFVVDWPALFARSRAIIEQLGVSLDVRTRVGGLSIAQQQIVEIAKVMSFEPAVLMFDEPTSALARRETERLFDLIRSLANRGVVVIYISHRLQELPEIADSITCLRDGRPAGTTPIAEATPATIVRMMFGETAQAAARPLPQRAESTALEVRGLAYGDILKDVSFSLRVGEILGVAGMLGSGRSELLMSIFGANRPDRGEILVGGTRAEHPTPAAMKRLGIAMTPESRKTQGIVPLMSIRDNGCLAALSAISVRGLIWRSRQKRVVDANVRDLHVKAPSIERAITTLSGGNQQKIVIGNWLNTRPRVLLLDEPTRGIDVHAKSQIFDIIHASARKGIACLFVSSELEELLEICHRVIVLHGGRITADLPAAGLGLETLFERCMAG